ncbi:MAG: SDR family NAD(P)-dependent oxidoreductase [Pseudomonadota bacterium]
MLIEFPGKTVIVTGGGHGLGRAIANAFADRGASVWICDLAEAEMKETAGMRIHWRVVDVGRRDAVFAFVEAVKAATGRIDVLVSNAGGVAGQVGRPLETVTEAEWKVLFDINVNGAFYFSQAVAPAMQAQNAGRIVNIASRAGLGVSLTGIQGYAAAKHALVGLTRQLAHELGRFGITVNSVAPGFVRSNPASERQWQSYGPEGQKKLIEGIALRRLGTPEDIAAAVLFLASDYAGYVTGQVLSVNGGA